MLILQALENSAVLAVHGQQVDAVLFDSIGHKMAARDKAFFVGQRQVGIKDYGTIFPGHGGILDRFDSVMFIAPFVSIAVRYFFYLL